MAKDDGMTRGQLEAAAKKFDLVLITEADAADYRELQCHKCPPPPRTIRGYGDNEMKE